MKEVLLPRKQLPRQGLPSREELISLLVFVVRVELCQCQCVIGNMWTALPMTHGSDNVTLLPYDRDFSCHKPITGSLHPLRGTSRGFRFKDTTCAYDGGARDILSFRLSPPRGCYCRVTDLELDSIDTGTQSGSGYKMIRSRFAD